MRLILLLLAILTLGVGLACNSAAKPTVTKTEPPKTEKSVDSHGHADDATRITLADAKKDFDAGTAVFVDTRDMSSYRSLRIKGAVNIPLASVDFLWKEVPRDKKIIAYCS